MAPFSICRDDEEEAVVLTVRGTLSIDDLLTDLAISMVEVKKEYLNPDVRGREFVHKVCVCVCVHACVYVHACVWGG